MRRVGSKGSLVLIASISGSLALHVTALQSSC